MWCWDNCYLCLFVCCQVETAVVPTCLFVVNSVWSTNNRRSHLFVVNSVWSTNNCRSHLFVVNSVWSTNNCCSHLFVVNSVWSTNNCRSHLFVGSLCESEITIVSTCLLGVWYELKIAVVPTICLLQVPRGFETVVVPIYFFVMSSIWIRNSCCPHLSVCCEFLMNQK